MAKSWRFGVCSGIAAVFVLACACSSVSSDDADVQGQEAKGARADALSAVVAIEGGCTAVKVGPKHLLLAARCVTNKPAFAMGRPIRFRKAVATRDDGPEEPGPKDSGAPTDASEAAAEIQDGATPDAALDGAGGGGDPNPGTLYEDTIAQIQIHPTYLKKCGTGACVATKPGTAEVADLAILVVSKEIADVEVAPIDLDPVAKDARVLLLSRGCSPGSEAATKLRAKATQLAPVDAALHTGSPYQSAPALKEALSSSYLITRGPGDPDARDALGVCSDRDVGAPLLLADGSAIVGINSVATRGTEPLPITNLHARVDARAAHDVGNWLAKAGATTTRSCSATAAGCKPLPPPPTTEQDSGTGTSDAGLKPPPSTTPTPPPLPDDDDYSRDDYEDDSPTVVTKPKPKKRASDSSCSAAPVSPSTSPLGIVALAATCGAWLSRRRTSRRDKPSR